MSHRHRAVAAAAFLVLAVGLFPPSVLLAQEEGPSETQFEVATFFASLTTSSIAFSPTPAEELALGESFRVWVTALVLEDDATQQLLRELALLCGEPAAIPPAEFGASAICPAAERMGDIFEQQGPPVVVVFEWDGGHPELASGFQATIVGTDPSRPVYDGVEGDPNTGHNFSFDFFWTGDGLAIATTNYVDNTFDFRIGEGPMVLDARLWTAFVLSGSDLAGMEDLEAWANDGWDSAPIPGDWGGLYVGSSDFLSETFTGGASDQDASGDEDSSAAEPADEAVGVDEPADEAVTTDEGVDEVAPEPPAVAAPEQPTSSGTSPLPFVVGAGAAVAAAAVVVQRRRKAAAAVAAGKLPQSGLALDEGDLTLEDLQQYAPGGGRELSDYDEAHGAAGTVITVAGPDVEWDALILQEHDLQQKIESDFGRVATALTTGFAAFVDQLDRFRTARAPVISATTEMDRSLVTGAGAIEAAQTADFLWAVLNLTRGAATIGFKASKWLNAPSKLPTIASVTGKVPDAIRQGVAQIPKGIRAALVGKHGAAHVDDFEGGQLSAFLRLADEAGEDPWRFISRFDNLDAAGEALIKQVMTSRGWRQIDFEVEWTLKRVLYNVTAALEGRVAHIPYADIEQLRKWSKLPGFWEALPTSATHTIDMRGVHIDDIMLAFDADQIKVLRAIAESEDLGSVLANVPDALKAPRAMTGPVILPDDPKWEFLNAYRPRQPLRADGHIPGVGPGGTTLGPPPPLDETLSLGGVNPFAPTQADGVAPWLRGPAAAPQRGTRPLPGSVDPSAPTVGDPAPPLGFNPASDQIVDTWRAARAGGEHSSMRVANNLEDTWLDLFPMDRTWMRFPMKAEDDIETLILAAKAGPGHTLVLTGNRAADAARHADPRGSFTTAILRDGEILYGREALDAASQSGSTVFVHGMDSVRGAIRNWRNAPTVDFPLIGTPPPPLTWYQDAIGETLLQRTAQYHGFAMNAQSALTGAVEGRGDLTYDLVLGLFTEPGIGVVGYPGEPGAEPPPITITPIINLQSCEDESLRSLGDAVGLDADLWTVGNPDFVRGFDGFLGELAQRRNWHPIDPEVKVQLDRLILDSRQWAVGGDAPAAGDVQQLKTWASRPGFFPWLVSTVAPAEEGVLMLYNVDDATLLQSVVAADGNIDVFRDELGPLQLQGLLALNDARTNYGAGPDPEPEEADRDKAKTVAHVDPQQLHYWKVVREYLSTTQTASMGIEAFLRSFGNIWEMDGPFHYWFFGMRSTDEGWHSEFLNTWWAFFSSPIETWTSWWWTDEAHDQFRTFAESQRENLSDMAMSMAAAVRALEDMRATMALLDNPDSGMSPGSAEALADIARRYKIIFDTASPEWMAAHRDEMIKRRSHILNKLVNLSRAKGPLSALEAQLGNFIDWLNALRLDQSGDTRPAFQLISPEVVARMGSVALALRSLASPSLLFDSGAADTAQKVAPWDTRSWMTPEERERRINSAFERAENPEVGPETPVQDGWGNPVDIVPDD